MTSSGATARQALRIIDANLNRIGEGLRLLEDMARLLLNDRPLTQKLKTMRHSILEQEWPLQQQFLQARDAEGDVGINLETLTEEKRRELPIVAVANARRVQESLRVIEELAKIPDIRPGLDPDKFKEARFSLYTIEKKLLSRLIRQDKAKLISGLYAILDTEALKGRNHLNVAGKIIQGGARIVQLRDKVLSKRELLPIARELRKLCTEHNVLFIINDYVDLAVAADADGVHVGQEDLPVPAARKLLPMNKIVGCSTTTVAEAVVAQSDGADYIAVGSIYPTLSKKEVKVVGLDMLRQVRQAVDLPLVAIGGITENNAGEVIASGADAVAVISAILDAEDIAGATRRIIGQLEKSK